MKKALSIILLITLLLTSCSVSPVSKKSDKISVISTAFVPYDFLREIGGNRINLSMLITPGTELHSYEPSPKDIIEISNSDLFIYVGGESDHWTENILNSDNAPKNALALTDCVTLLESHSEHNHIDYDEHVWTSLNNSIQISNAIADMLCKLDEVNADYYKDRLMNYTDKLLLLHEKFKEVVNTGKRKTIVFGDRFPLMYFAHEYGLEYFSAYPGCAAEAEPSSSEIAFLIEKVKSENIPVVFHIEMSNENVANTISLATGAKKQVFYSCHNISADDFNASVTFIDLMEKNLVALKEALN